VYNGIRPERAADVFAGLLVPDIKGFYPASLGYECVFYIRAQNFMPLVAAHPAVMAASKSVAARNQ
jgi:hypothetical protein